MKHDGSPAPQHRLADLREWLMSQIDGSEETRGDDGLISDFIRQIDAQEAELAERRDVAARWHTAAAPYVTPMALYEALRAMSPPSETGPIPASKTQAKRFAAQLEPRGCPTPGACSCPGTIPAVEREKVMEAHRLAATVETPRTDAEWACHPAPQEAEPWELCMLECSRTLERELIDLKQRLLPQFQGRAQRAEHERDALLEQLIASKGHLAAAETQLQDAWRKVAEAMDAAPSATGEPVAWMYEENGERMFGHPDGYRPTNAVPLYAGRHPDAGGLHGKD
jgi:hypothetical protein